MALPSHLHIAWVGDDFTGAAASMEALEFAGVPAVLFLDVPTADQMQRFEGARAIGIATTARSHSPEWMAEYLPPIYTFLKSTGAPIIHYKVCSTLDSAPEVGSIGKALDIGAEIIGTERIPFLVAAPVMRRYQAFGHLFAGMDSGVFRLDEHPVMARHPVTPMQDSHVARHLSRQTDRATGTITLEDLETDPYVALEQQSGIVTLDAMTDAHMARIGGLILDQPVPCLVGGSQGVEYALVAHWQKSGILEKAMRTRGVEPVEQIIAVSGSVSPTTAAQIAWAERNSFEIITLDAAETALGGPVDQTFEQAVAALEAGQDVLICSARGPQDPAVARMRAAVAGAGATQEAANARIGAALGTLLKRLLHKTGLRRAVISGGDTSGHACRALGLFAFTALAPTVPGAALLAAHSDDPALAGLQLALKGGQMGTEDYFGWIKRGGGAAQGEEHR